MFKPRETEADSGEWASAAIQEAPEGQSEAPGDDELKEPENTEETQASKEEEKNE